MERSEVLSLMVEARTAADPRHCGLCDYRDLQQLLKRLSEATGELLREIDERDGRLRRSGLLEQGEQSMSMPVPRDISVVSNPRLHRHSKRHLA